MKLLSLSCVCLLLVASSLVQAQEWTRFRGPNGSGISEAKTIPVQWSADGHLWKTSLPGEGISSPVIWGKQLYITSANASAGQRYLLCINADDGSELWKREFTFAKYKKHSNNSFASNTPVVDEDHVYVLWQSKKKSTLTAITHDNKVIWTFDLGPYDHGQGGATSPIVYDDTVFVCNDQKKNSFLLAVDRKTGKEKWKIPRQGKRACYTTPCVFQFGKSKPEIIFTHCFEGIVGIEPETGTQKWMIDVFGRFAQRAVGSPFQSGDMIISSSGARLGDKNVVAVRPGSVKDDGKPEEVFRVTKTAPHVPTPVAFGEWLFLWNDTGVVTCTSLKDGSVVWQKRVGGNFFGSPVCIDGKLYNVDLEGNVVVIAAGPKFEALATNSLGEPSRSTPAVANKTLFIRTYSTIFAFRK